MPRKRQRPGDAHARRQSAGISAGTAERVPSREPPPRVPAAATAFQPRWLIVALGVLAAALLAYRVFVLVPQRLFDTDEFEHLQAAWLMGRGMVIYRDFFEHHPPLLYVLLESLHGLPDTSGKLIAARMMMIPFGAGILAFSWWAAAKQGGMLAGALACAFLSTLAVFQHKVVEIRPDVPALFLLTLAIALQSAAVLSLRRLAVIGVVLGSALLFTSKLLFAAPAFALMAIPRSDEQGSPFIRAAVLCAAFAVPLLAVAAWLESHDALRSAFHLNVTFNAAVPSSFRSSYLAASIGRSLRQNPLFWCAAAISVVASVIAIRWPRTTEARAKLVIIGAVAGMAAGMCVIQVPLQQYLMSLAALLAIVTGVQTARLLATPYITVRWLAVAATGVVLLQPVPTLLHARRDNNHAQIASLRHIWATVPANDRVFDCWTGMGLFRRPAYFYGFLGPDIIGALETLDAPALDANLILSLARHRPAIISDPALATLPPSVAAYIENHYFPDRTGLLLMPMR